MAQPETGRQTVRLPFVGYEKAYQASGTPSAFEWSDQIFVNCYPVVNKNPSSPDPGEVVIMSRPGIREPEQNRTHAVTLANMLTTAEPLAVLGVKGLSTETIIAVYAGFDTVAVQEQLRVVAYVPGSSGSQTLVGTINLTSYSLTASTVEVHLTQITNGAALPGVAIAFHPENYRNSTSSNSDVYYSIYSGGAWGALGAIGSNFPTNAPVNKGIVGGLVQLNNVHYIMTVDGYIYGSYPSLTYPFNPDITTWNAQGNTATVQSPDGGMGLVRYKHHLLAFGQSSCEFFNDEGLAQPNLPIRRTQQAFFKLGLLNARCFAHVDDDLYFLGYSGDNSHVGLYRLSGYTPELVSPLKLNTAFQDRAQYLACLQTINLNGVRHIITNIYHVSNPDWQSLPAAENPVNIALGGVLCYAIDSNAWWLLSFDAGDVSLSEGRVHIQVANTMGSSLTNQWVFVVLNTTGSGGYNYSLHPCQLYSYLHISAAATFDAFRRGNTAGPVVTENYTIPVLYISNRYDLGTTQRKTIHRIRIVADRPVNINTGSAPTSDFTAIGHTLALGLFKDKKADNAASNTDADLTRSYDLVTLIDNPTMDWNNLGTMRKFKLKLQCNTWLFLRLEAFEVTYTTAQH